MREFTNVLTYMISLCEDNFDLKHKLEKVYEDSSFTAPEALWDIRGREVSDILYYYACAGSKPYSQEFLAILGAFTERPETELREFIQKLRKEQNNGSK